ncbi:sphingosine 1-phosphate receptor 3a [Conger conger]|uniref:sphingosine 1-phosphate receptor 3a n=1 Tax=Conger conger TaxID=82655 RepID=UPI002A59A34A|nr:sphingosine 1-phosphate receptor 3a [Conger conger]
MNAEIVNHYNHSGKLIRPLSSEWKRALPVLICVLIVLENLTVLLSVVRNKRFHSRMYYLIGNLAVSDMLAGVAYIVNILTSGEKTFSLTPYQWLAREGSMFVALGASTFSLLAIGIERHMTMVRLTPCETASRGRLPALLVACWVVAVLLGALPSLGWNCRGRLESCSTVLPLYAKSYVAFCISVFMALQAAIVVLYTRIYRLVTSSSRRISGKPSERSLALLRTVVIVLGVFVVCWAPLFVLLLLDVGCSPKSCPVLYEADGFVALAVVNSALNPLIYTLSSREMRAAFFRLLCCCCPSQLQAPPPSRHAGPGLGIVMPTPENSKSVAGGVSMAGTGVTKSRTATPLSSTHQAPDQAPSAPTHPQKPPTLLSVVLAKAGDLPSLGKS